MDYSGYKRQVLDALASSPNSNDYVISSNSSNPLLKTRRRSSLSQSTTLSDMLKTLRVSSSTEDDQNDFATSTYESSKKCFKCAACSSGKLGTMANTARRRSSSSIIYSELLSNSNTTSKQVPFNLKMSASTGTKFRQLRMPFKAKFMGSTGNNSDSYSESASSPYFAEIDLNEYYINKEIKKPITGKKRKFPGFEIPKKGQLQLIIFNNEKIMNSVILLPYNSSRLRKNYKKIVKFRTFKVMNYSPDGTSSNMIVGSGDAQQERIETQKLINEIELKFINYKNEKYYIFDKIKILFNNTTEDHRIPLNLYSLPLKSPILKNIDRSRFQFNPKLPILPSKVISKLDEIQSDEYPVDISYFINTCEFCGCFDKLKRQNNRVSSCAILDDDDKDQAVF